jgi:hypothetical protein
VRAALPPAVSDNEVLDEFDAETDAEAHQWGNDASMLLELPARRPADR